MAAAAVGRWCACGCGQSIDDRPIKSTRTKACQRRAELERWRARGATAQTQARDTLNHSRMSVNPRQHYVRSAYVGDEGNRRQRPCQVCCGQPWARTPERYGEDGRSIVDELGRCRGCGDAYAPEPPPTRESTIGSSAGVATRHGDLFGIPVEGGACKVHPSRKRVKKP